MDIRAFFELLIVVGIGGFLIAGLLFSLYLMVGPDRRNTVVHGIIMLLGTLTIIGMLGVAVFSGVG